MLVLLLLPLLRPPRMSRLLEGRGREVVGRAQLARQAARHQHVLGVLVALCGVMRERGCCVCCVCEVCGVCVCGLWASACVGDSPFIRNKKPRTTLTSKERPLRAAVVVVAAGVRRRRRPQHHLPAVVPLVVGAGVDPYGGAPLLLLGWFGRLVRWMGWLALGIDWRSGGLWQENHLSNPNNTHQV